ncbi:MAG: 3',5'-cyclic-nucleotide phosphodiesterase [candidate division NC10 bacterium]|nr:3',5'-cyclic-nucleotide phosphodiesterase [candidate division NC10 bacterium]
MRIRVLGCFGGEAPGFHHPSFLIDEELLLDAGSVTSSLSLEEQARIDHILVTHAHINHTAGLAFLADNVFGCREKPVLVYSLQEVLKDLKDHLFNDILWPDFTRLPSPSSPTLEFMAIPERVPFRIGDYTIRAVRVDHVVEAVGFFVERDGNALLYTGDTGPTDEVWRVARSMQSLKAIITESSFPNRYKAVANASKHLTPDSLREELKKVDPRIPIYIYHVKPQFLKEIAEELQQVTNSPIQLMEEGRSYQV